MDFFFDREPFAEYATEILNLCEEKKIIGFTTPVIISNVYYLLSKVAKHQIIIEKIKQLLTIVDIVKMDKNVVLNSLNSDFKDFEDALQNFSAVENGKIKIILTRNIKDFKKSKLAVLTPETYLKGKASG
jgi:predicted nucleic acid-binding protein